MQRQCRRRGNQLLHSKIQVYKKKLYNKSMIQISKLMQNWMYVLLIIFLIFFLADMHNSVMVDDALHMFSREVAQVASDIEIFICGNSKNINRKYRYSNYNYNDFHRFNKDGVQEILIANVIKVYDGDTIKVNILGLPSVFGRNLSVRLAGIDTPEIRGSKCAVEKCLAVHARDALERLLGMPSDSVVVHLAEVKRGKYFRLVANVLVEDITNKQWKDASEIMLTDGWAIPYNGKKKNI